MKSRSEVVSFRCPAELGSEIDRARQPFQISRGDWVRSAVLAQLTQADQQTITDQIDELRQAVAAITDNLQSFNRQLAKVAYLVLTNDRLTVEDAKGLVRRHLLPDEGAS